jgi:hypothetical protein
MAKRTASKAAASITDANRAAAIESANNPVSKEARAAAISAAHKNREKK